MGNQRSGRTSDLLAKCGLTTLSMCRMCKSEYWKEKLKAEREKGG